MQNNPTKSNEQTSDKQKPHRPPHDIPPHILKELLDIREKIGKLEGQIDILLRIQNKN